MTILDYVIKDDDALNGLNELTITLARYYFNFMTLIQDTVRKQLVTKEDKRELAFSFWKSENSVVTDSQA